MVTREVESAQHRSTKARTNPILHRTLRCALRPPTPKAGYVRQTNNGDVVLDGRAHEGRRPVLRAQHESEGSQYLNLILCLSGGKAIRLSCGFGGWCVWWVAEVVPASCSARRGPTLCRGRCQSGEHGRTLTRVFYLSLQWSHYWNQNLHLIQELIALPKWIVLP